MPSFRQLSHYYRNRIPNNGNIEQQYFWEGFTNQTNIGLVKSALGDIYEGFIAGNEIPGKGDEVAFIPGIPIGQIFVRQFVQPEIIGAVEPAPRGDAQLYVLLWLSAANSDSGNNELWVTDSGGIHKTSITPDTFDQDLTYVIGNSSGNWAVVYGSKLNDTVSVSMGSSSGEIAKSDYAVTGGELFSLYKLPYPYISPLSTESSPEGTVTTVAIAQLSINGSNVDFDVNSVSELGFPGFWITPSTTLDLADLPVGVNDYDANIDSGSVWNESFGTIIESDAFSTDPSPELNGIVTVDFAYRFGGGKLPSGDNNLLDTRANFANTVYNGSNIYRINLLDVSSSLSPGSSTGSAIVDIAAVDTTAISIAEETELSTLTFIVEAAKAGDYAVMGAKYYSA